MLTLRDQAFISLTLMTEKWGRLRVVVFLSQQGLGLQAGFIRQDR